VILLWSCPRCYLTFLKSFFFLFHCCTLSLIIPHYLSLFPLPLTAFLPHFPFWCSDPLLTQRALSWSLFLYFHSIITWAAVFLSIVASITVLKDHSTRGTKQGNSKHAPKTRHIASIKVLNPLRFENQSPNRSLGLHPFQVCTGTWASHFMLSAISLITFPSSSICKQQLLTLNFPHKPAPWG
jgi:hypothetical protein